MAVSETARLIASLELKDLFTKQVDNATKSLGKLDKSIDSTQGRAYKAGTQIGTGIKRGAAIAVGAFAFLAANVALGVKSLEDVEKVTAQTNAVLKSTKDASGQTAQGIRDMSNAFESLNATMDDTAIQSGANVLLTFTNITNKAFKPALQAALDLSTAMGQDLQSSVVQIGKALNDPVKGMTALQRVGVTFTAQQKQQIKALAGSGDEASKLAAKINKSKDALALLTAEGKGNSKAADNLRTKIDVQSKAYKDLSAKAKDTSGLYKAQQIILAELNREFGGSFLAQGNTTAGKIAKVRDAVDDLQRALATALLPALGRLADYTTKTLTDPSVVDAVKNFGDQLGSLFTDENLTAGVNAVKGFVGTVVAAAPILEASAKATLGFVQAAVGVFNSLPDPLKALVAGGFALNKLTGGLVTNIGGALIDLVGKSRGASPANPVFVSDVTGGAGLGAVAGKGGLAGSLANKVGGAILGVTIVGMVAEVADLIHGSISPGGGLQGRTQSGTLLAGDQLSWPFGPKDTPHIDIGPFKDILGGDSTFRVDAPALTALTAPTGQATNNRTAGSILDRGGREQGFNVLAGKIHDDANFIGDLLRQESKDLRDALNTLAKSRSSADITKAVKLVENQLISQGRGNLSTTRAAERSIREALKHTHDPQTQAVLRAALKDVQGKIPGREYAQRQLAKADGIIRSTRSVHDKIVGLQAIENDLKNHKLPGQTRALQQKIDALKASDAAQQARTRQAIEDKKAQVIIRNQIDTITKIDSKVIGREVRRISKLYALPI